jgi:UDPglucose 6-dehydrogenase
MRIGFIGLGKLGLPLALAIESKGHTVGGYDPNLKVMDILRTRKLPYIEEGAQDLLDKTKLRYFSTPEKMVDSLDPDLAFVAVQTPHDPEFEGTTPLTKERKDFDYSYLVQACQDLADAGGSFPVAIISTALPGTIERLCVPILGADRVVYNPSFIAMGTAVQDFLNPEFVLLGVDRKEPAEVVKQFYRQTLPQALTHGFIQEMSIASAELTKVAYNTFIGLKIVFANHLAEVSEAVGADVDQVCDALAHADRRLISPAYMRAGMGDAGGCHPRDNIALSWLAGKIHESYDLPGEMMKARELQSLKLANLISRKHYATSLPVVICGKAYKKGTNLTIGSAATLLANQLEGMGVPFVHLDPVVDPKETIPLNYPMLYVLATNHDLFAEMAFPRDSIVIDPWGYVPKRNRARITYISPGRK